MLMIKSAICNGCWSIHILVSVYITVLGMSWLKSKPVNHMQKHRGCNLDFALLGLKVKKLTLTCRIDQSCYLV